MIKAPIDLQDLKRRLYAKAKAEPPWCFPRRGFGWKRWSSRWRFVALGLIINTEGGHDRKSFRHDRSHKP